MKLVDSRRLTGPNLYSREPLALAEVAFEPGEDRARAVEAWRREAARLCERVELPFDRPIVRESKGGAALAFHATIDVLLAATEINDYAVAPGDIDAIAGPLREKIADARKPALLALQRESRARRVPFLWDDASISIGYGAQCRQYPVAGLPAQIDWPPPGRIPIALITGTNGKTTSARLLARMALLAGKTPGLASTDALAVRGEVIDRGDFTGPVAARIILRDRRVDAAVLETARGGILRRGLAVEEADAALLTNVDDDHLGEYGIDTVDDLVRAKAVITSVVPPAGRIVLNADDPRLLALAGKHAAPTVLFSLDGNCAAVRAHTAAGGESFALRNDWLCRITANAIEPLIPARDVALSFGGAARFNLANALGALAVAPALGIPLAPALEALRTFQPSQADNPGRCNLVDVGGISLLIDFGHNPHGVRAVGPLAKELLRARGGAGRLFALTGAAGDRSDEALRSLAGEIHALSPARVWVRELDGYLRGRAPGEIPALLQSEFIRLGMTRANVSIAPSEGAALAAALDEARAGDLVLLLVHLEDDEVREVLAARGAKLE